MTYRVTINKETHLGEAENPYRDPSGEAPSTLSKYWQWEKENPALSVFTSNNIQVLEGEFECVKVWQGRTILGGNERSHWFYLTYNSDALTPEEWAMQGYDVRQIYKVVLSVKEEAETEITEALNEYSKEVSGQKFEQLVDDGNGDGIGIVTLRIVNKVFSDQKQQTIDKVVAILIDWKISNPLISRDELEALLTKIKELK